MPPRLSLPYDSTLRFHIGKSGYGIGGTAAAQVDLGGWEIPRDGKKYFLHVLIDVPQPKEKQADKIRLWFGKIEIPPVEIPVNGRPLDAATIGARIDELGAQLLQPRDDRAEAAEQELSLIDDPRVIPWFVKAVRLPNYDRKFAAIERLARFDGDEALEGLKIGMRTRGGDIANCTTGIVAEQCADNIRVEAAQCLAGSPHPLAKTLLMSMQSDGCDGVRISVAQAAVNMNTPQSLDVLKKIATDRVETVRSEAARLLAIREKNLKE